MAKKAVKRTQEPHRETVIIEVPLGPVTENEYLSSHVEARFTTTQQRRTFRRLLRGLQQSGARTANGKAVQRPGDVLRWVVEQIAPPQ